MTPARDPKLGFVCYHDLGGIWEASGRHLGGIWEASTSGFPPSLNNESHKLNIQYYQYVVHGIFETSPKCLQRIWNHRNKIMENPSQGLHFNMLLGLGSCPGRLGDHPGMGTLKTTKRSLFETVLLEHICDRCWHFCGHVFYMFPRHSLLPSFCSGRCSQVSIL